MPSLPVGLTRTSLLAFLLCAPSPLAAQQASGAQANILAEASSWNTGRAEPGYVPGLHVRVLLPERRLRLQDGGIVLLDVPASVGRADTLRYGDREWTFSTPPGQRVVLAKEAYPVWIPPDWHYAERAIQNGWEVVHLEGGKGIGLADGSQITVRGGRVVRVFPNGRVEPAPLGEDIVVNDTLVVPPFGTANRRLRGELGRFKLDLGDGYLIHGTPREETIGGAVTHGCVHLAAEPLESLFQAVPLGAPVFIY